MREHNCKRDGHQWDEVEDGHWICLGCNAVRTEDVIMGDDDAD